MAAAAGGAGAGAAGGGGGGGGGTVWATDESSSAARRRTSGGAGAGRTPGGEAGRKGERGPAGGDGLGTGAGLSDPSTLPAAVVVQFVSEEGEECGNEVQLPTDVGPAQLRALLAQLLKDELAAGARDARMSAEQLDDAQRAVEERPYAFFVENHEVVGAEGALGEVLLASKVSTEDRVTIVYQPQATFRVAPVSRCSDSMAGHSEAVLCVQFSPDGSVLATGGGDKLVRLWDVHTATPQAVLRGHQHWVLYLQWSPDGKKLASGGMDKTVRLWHTETGKQLGKPLVGHQRYVTAIAWEPLSKDPSCRRLATGSKDGLVKVWDTVLQKCLVSMSGHAASVTSLRWGVAGCIFSGSQDKTIKVWNDGTAGAGVDAPGVGPGNKSAAAGGAGAGAGAGAAAAAEATGGAAPAPATAVAPSAAALGTMVAHLKGHGHWVNSLALNTDYATRTGCFNERGHVSVPDDGSDPATAAARRRDGTRDVQLAQSTPEQRRAAALAKVHKVLQVSGGVELLASGSDDFTMFLWQPLRDARTPLARMTGHQQLINCVAFSPDGRWLVSGSFDKSVRLWNGTTGEFVTTFRGHVEAVYQCAWSADSRLIVSASRDSTLKLWDPSKQAAKGTHGKKQIRGMRLDLPGHADEVFAVDWSPDGQRVASGSKDRLVKIWRN